MQHGVVGNTVLKVLEEKQLPISQYSFFASAKSKGKEIQFNGQPYFVQELTEHSFDSGFDFAIFSAGSETARKFAPIAVSNGCVVIDNSSCFRMDDTVPLVVPEVNPNTICEHSGIIANPNCSTIQAVVALKPLDDHYSIKRILYSTYQAVSGAGQNGIDDFYNTNLPPKKFPHPIYNNCIPHIDTFLDNGYSKEEMKLIKETQKILNKPNLKISATAVRVPVLNSHSESINVEFEKDFDLTELKELLSHSPGIILQDDLDSHLYPLAANACGKDEVFVGRIRRDTSVPFGINLWVVADNIRKGAATNAVQILETMMKGGYVL